MSGSASGEDRTASGSGDAEVLLEVRDLHTTYAVRGSFFDRLKGRDTGSVRAVDGVTLDLWKGEACVDPREVVVSDRGHAPLKHIRAG